MMRRPGPPLSETARRLLAEERQCPPEDEALKQRILLRASEALAPERPSGVALRRVASSGPAPRAPRAALLIAAAVAAAGLAAAGAGMYAWEAPAESPARALAPRLTSKAAAPLPLRARVAPEAQADPPAAEPPPAASPIRGVQASSVQQYTIELGLLEPARKSIAHGDYAGAMSAIARHQREYPRGQLAEEREALRVRALWGTGQKVSAENAATAFRKRYPRSVLLSWMKEPASPPPKK
jgi:hypothetical protein